MLIDIPFYDKQGNPDVKVDTWHGGLTLTLKNAHGEGVDEIYDVALPTDYKGVYWSRGLGNFLENYSDYRVIRFSQHKFPSIKAHLKYLEEWGEGYGVADSIEQVLDAFPQYSFDDRTFVLTVSKVKRNDQPEHQGWRWSKWGDYIGTQNSMADYLYDEPEIEELLLFEFIEVVPCHS